MWRRATIDLSFSGFNRDCEMFSSSPISIRKGSSVAVNEGKLLTLLLAGF